MGKAFSTPSGLIDTPPPLTIVVGHYGVGKTNLALNLALRWLGGMGPGGGWAGGGPPGGGRAGGSPPPGGSPAGRSPAGGSLPGVTLTLIDLDVVNPYFRSSDSAGWLTERGVTMLGPSLARSSLDTPSLAPGINAAMTQASSERPVLIDVGGDPDGARALARFRSSIVSRPYQMVYVANFNRPEVASPDDSLAVLREIEAQSGLRATCLINNSHLKQLSSVQQTASTLAAMLALADASGLSVAAVAVPDWLAQEFSAWLASDSPPAARGLPVLPLTTLVSTPWE